MVRKADALIAMEIIHCHVLCIPMHSAHVPIVQNGLMKGMKLTCSHNDI